MDITPYYVAAYHNKKFKAQFESYIKLGNIPEVDCWIWLGLKDHRGYGVILYGYSVLRAHRFMYLLVTERYPHHLHIHHKCENKPCVNPYHLEALTPEQHRKAHSTRRWKGH